MKFAFYWCSIIVVLTLCVFSFTNVSYAQNEENYTSAIIITGIGLELTKQALLINNYDSAEKYSILTNNFYGKNIQFLRAFNADFSDEVQEEELHVEKPPNEEGLFLGMTPVQRFIIALMLLFMIIILGVLFLLVTEKIVLPIFG